VIPIAKIYNIEYFGEVYIKVFINGLLFATCGYSVAVMFSCIFEKGVATALSTGTFLAMYILNVMSSLKDDLVTLKYFSFFHFLDLTNILAQNTIDIHSILVFLLAIASSTIIGMIYFIKRDISV